MARGKEIVQYNHPDEQRPYTPPVGLVDPDTDRDGDPRQYKYSTYVDPNLEWAGKKKSGQLKVPTVSLHLHERIDPITIIEKILKKETHVQETLTRHFEDIPNITPHGKRSLEFYQHSNNWSNRLIAGDSLLVMNSLLCKEGMESGVQLVYIDPPYGIAYGSNFQPFLHKRGVVDKNDDDLVHSPETVRAFRDTWELGIHSYLSYLRDRLLLARKLLKETGSCAVQISDENLHYVRSIMDEVFGVKNFVSIIAFVKKNQVNAKTLPTISDFIVWYAKDKNKMTYNQLYLPTGLPIQNSGYNHVEEKDGTRRKLTKEEEINPLLIPPGAKIYGHRDIRADGGSKKDDRFKCFGEVFEPGPNKHWKVSLQGMARLLEKNRLVKTGKLLMVIRYHDDFGYSPVTNVWSDTSSGFQSKIYVVQTTVKTIRRFMLMTTNPGDLVFDPTCGSGTTAFVAEEFGRRWITCDTQRVAIALAKRRLMTATYDYFELANSSLGVRGGFLHTPPRGAAERITPGSLASDKPPELVKLHDRPDVGKDKIRVSGPFTVEAVPSPTAMSVDTAYDTVASSASDKENRRQDEWRTALQKSGIRARDGTKIDFMHVKPCSATKYLHAEGRTNETKPKTFMFSFGSPYAPLDTRQVELALSEARKLENKPDVVVFAAMQFDPEAARDIDDRNWPGIRTLKAQMSADMLVGDLKNGDPHSDAFMLVGKPDVQLLNVGDGQCEVVVRGFDYYDAKDGEIKSGSASQIAMWMIDTDYDGRSIYPQQVFFPMATGAKGDGWAGIARSLEKQIDHNFLQLYSGTRSLSFAPGKYRRVAVKIIDDRGIELIRVLGIDNG